MTASISVCLDKSRPFSQGYTHTRTRCVFFLLSIYIFCLFFPISEPHVVSLSSSYLFLLLSSSNFLLLFHPPPLFVLTSSSLYHGDYWLTVISMLLKFYMNIFHSITWWPHYIDPTDSPTSLIQVVILIDLNGLVFIALYRIFTLHVRIKLYILNRKKVIGLNLDCFSKTVIPSEQIKSLFLCITKR